MTTTIPATCDALGHPTGVHFTPGQTHDVDGADVLLPGLKVETIIADKAVDPDTWVIEPLSKVGLTIVIPSKANRIFSRTAAEDLDNARHLIETVCARLEPFRASAPCDAKCAAIFLGAIYLAASLTWLT